MTTQEHQPTRETMQEKTLDVVHIIEEKSVDTVLIVEKDVKPYEQLLIKCKDDWIHHLAQALSFSLLTNLVAIAILLLAIGHVIQGNLDKQAQQMLTGGLESIIPQPLSLPVGDVVNKAFDTLSHASAIAVFFIILPAILFGSFLFSLMESCFDVIYHLPPRPFVRRHFVVTMLLFFYLFALGLLLRAEVNAVYAEGIHVPKSDLITQASNGGYE